MLTILAFAFQLAAAPAAPPALDSAVHVLNRLAYGGRPGQAAALANTGVRPWIEDQLRTDPAAADPGTRAGLTRFSLFRHDTRDLAGAYRDMVAARADRQRRDSSTSPNRPDPTPAGRNFRMLVGQLPAIATYRAARAEHQLVEVLADFWTNHFNVFLNKNLVPVYLPEYLERVIRPRVFGTFEALLVATARSPAMLLYLDNAQSVAPGTEPPQLARLRQLQRSPRRAAARRPGADSALARLMERMPTGVNENYARELLELHTLGVDGGYTQADVVDVARLLTGWSVERGGVRREPGGFIFNAWAHDNGRKVVLDSVFPAGGSEEEGLRLLHILANHPATIHHLSAKLCARLVADEPPDGCVDDAARAWRATGGNLREVVRAIVSSPDFWAPANRLTKIKTPLEFVMSAARALDADPDTTRALAGAVARLGQPLLQQSAPTGYPEAQEDWVNSGALLARMNFAVALAAGRIPGVAVDLDNIVPIARDAAALVAAVDRAILAGRMTDHTRATIEREVARVADPHAARALAVGLALGGPEFQRQ